MTFDKEEHKVFFLHVLAATPFKGEVVDLVYELKKAAESAKIEQVDS